MKNELKRRQIQFETLYMPQKRTPWFRYITYLGVAYFLIMVIVWLT